MEKLIQKSHKCRIISFLKMSALWRTLRCFSKSRCCKQTFFHIQSDQKVSVNLTITVQTSDGQRIFLITLYIWSMS